MKYTNVVWSFLLLVVSNMIYAEQTEPQITVYKSPTCGCCNAWIQHLEKNGFKVIAENRNDMPMIKGASGIKEQYQSCHTAFVGNYFLEGHVPAKDIKRLLKEKPSAAGLAVPGMPMGSPGMEGPTQDHYSVMLIKKNGSAVEYSHY